MMDENKKWRPQDGMLRQNGLKCKMQRNPDKCREMQSNAEKCREMQRNVEKCREMLRNVE